MGQGGMGRGGMGRGGMMGRGGARARISARIKARLRQWDENADRKLSLQEWKGREDVFHRIDVNGDGVLEREEFVDTFSQRGQGGFSRGGSEDMDEQGSSSVPSDATDASTGPQTQ